MKYFKTIILISLLPLSAFGWDGWKLTAPPVGGESVADGSAFSFALDYRYRRNSEIFLGSSQIDNPNDVATEFHQVALTSSYRLSQDWLLSARIPFTDATRSEDGKSDNAIRGLGDISLSTIYSPWTKTDSRWRNLSFNAGLILPTGTPRNNPRTGLFAPGVFQLGTGATQLAVGANYFGSLSDDWSYFSGINTTLPLYESSRDFLPAETYSLRAGISRLITENLNAKLSFDLFHGGRDEFQGIEIGNTGSTVLSLNPALIYSINDNLSVSASIIIPLHQRVNEVALGVGPLSSFGVSFSFWCKIKTCHHQRLTIRWWWHLITKSNVLYSSSNGGRS